ncbi:type III secretion system protein [Klebsiella indica]|uniref:Type III secretion system protein n=1 Tax=Klebsiella indica TaxID=2582917 RepID=A0A5R9LE70_9ENTR|nr:type III secretion system protein [Klebsiella indica]
MDLALSWLRWWCIDCWLTAEPAWRQADFYQLDEATLRQLARTHHQQLCARLQLPASIAAVDDTLLQLMQLSSPLRLRVLRLVAEVCWRDSSRHTLTADQQRWCRRIAQAMRPGLWLTPPPGIPTGDGAIDGLWLLNLRCGPLCWPRVRLHFSPDRVQAVERLPPLSDFPSRLLPLWQAAIWQAAQEPLC